MEQLADGRTTQSYDCVLGSEPRILNVLQVRKLAEDNVEPAQLQDRSKEQGEELIKIDLVEEGKETNHVFLDKSLPTELEQAVLDL